MLFSALQDILSKWKDSVACKVFKCISENCSNSFISWAGLLNHFHECESFKSLAYITANATLPCHVCSNDFSIKKDFSKHMRLQHRDVCCLTLFSSDALHILHCENFSNQRMFVSRPQSLKAVARFYPSNSNC